MQPIKGNPRYIQYGQLLVFYAHSLVDEVCEMGNDFIEYLDL